jgi:hypothetical protein
MCRATTPGRTSRFPAWKGLIITSSRSVEPAGTRVTPAEVAKLFDVPMDMPLLTIQRMLRCAPCGLPAGYFYQHNPDDQAARVMRPASILWQPVAGTLIRGLAFGRSPSGAGLLLCSPLSDDRTILNSGDLERGRCTFCRRQVPLLYRSAAATGGKYIAVRAMRAWSAKLATAI